MYIIICPNCSQDYQVKYHNADTYCFCEAPRALTLVPSFDDSEFKLLDYYHYLETGEMCG